MKLMKIRYVISIDCSYCRWPHKTWPASGRNLKCGLMVDSNYRPNPKQCRSSFFLCNNHISRKV